MQIGVFSDVHGNWKALQAVWSALTAEGLTARTVLNAGDNVGYGDAPEACARFLQAHDNIVTVQGNYDKNIALFPEKQAEYSRKWGKTRPEKYAAIRHDSEAISKKTRAWLLDLPKEELIVVDDVPILVTHYAPGVRVGLGRWTDDAQLGQLAQQTSAQIVVCGHTHSSFARRAGGVLFLNPGTVGRPLFGGPAYAVLTLHPDQPPVARLNQLPTL